jgi:hypothetical protein
VTNNLAIDVFWSFENEEIVFLPTEKLKTRNILVAVLLTKRQINRKYKQTTQKQFNHVNAKIAHGHSSLVGCES